MTTQESGFEVDGLAISIRSGSVYKVLSLTSYSVRIRLIRKGTDAILNREVGDVWTTTTSTLVPYGNNNIHEGEYNDTAWV